MLAFVLAPVYLILNLYIIRRCLDWFSAFRPGKDFNRRRSEDWTLIQRLLPVPHTPFQLAFCFLYGLLALSPAFAFLLPTGGLQRFLQAVSGIWLGVLLYLSLFVILSGLVGLGFRSTFCSRSNFLKAGALTAVLVISVSTYGYFHARSMQTASYHVDLDKSCGSRTSLRVVLASDLHLGYHVGVSQLERMVSEINRANPDLVCLAGDLFDNEYEAMADPQRLADTLSQIQSPLGVYACYGNHDVAERLLSGFTFDFAKMKTSDPRMDALLKKAGIRLLQDEVLLIDSSFYLAGRRDASKPGTEGGRLSAQGLLSGLDPQKPILVLDHEPRDLDALEDAGADLILSGHTHKGQVMPVNFLMGLIWENPYGLLRKGDMYSVVTSGAGVWGPAMRVGTDCEIAVICLEFADARSHGLDPAAESLSHNSSPVRIK